MKRLFYLFKDLDKVVKARDDLRSADNLNHKFRVISHDKAGLQKREIPVESILVRKDLLRFLQRGAIIGAVVGAVIILVLMYLVGIEWPLGAWVALFLFSLFAGTAGSGFGGITADHIHVRPYTDYLAKGQHLVMIDAPDDEVADVKEMMVKHGGNSKLRDKDDATVTPWESTDEEPDATETAIDNPDNQGGPRQ